MDVCGHIWTQVDIGGRRWQSKQDVLLNRVERSYLEDSSYEQIQDGFLRYYFFDADLVVMLPELIACVKRSKDTH